MTSAHLSSGLRLGVCRNECEHLYTSVYVCLCCIKKQIEIYLFSFFFKILLVFFVFRVAIAISDETALEHVFN